MKRKEGSKNMSSRGCGCGFGGQKLSASRREAAESPQLEIRDASRVARRRSERLPSSAASQLRSGECPNGVTLDVRKSRHTKPTELNRTKDTNRAAICHLNSLCLNSPQSN